MHEYLDLLVLNFKRLSQSSSNQWLLIFDNLDCECSSSAGDLEAFDVKRDFPEADRLWRLVIEMKLGPVDELQEENILMNSFGKSVAGELT